MNIENLYIVSKKRTRFPDEDITHLRKNTEFAFPNDLCDFLTELGAGEFCGCLFVYRPKDLLSGQSSLREHYAKTWRYAESKSALSQEEALRSTWVGGTLDGDEIVHLSGQKPGFYVLPRHSDAILQVGRNFDEVLQWFCSSGVLYRPSRVKWFCTFEDRCRLHLVKEEELSHAHALSLVQKTFGVEHADLDEDEDFSILFCPRISGYVHIYSDNLDIHYDLDFDQEVCRDVDRVLQPLGFRVVEHHIPRRQE